jgi:hypothetical protein
MSQFVHDTFTDADGTLLTSHTGETGATWARYPGYTTDATITSNRVRGNGAADAEVHYASGVPASADYDVEAVVKVVSLLAGDIPQFMARADHTVSAGSDTFYFVRYFNDGAEWFLGKAVGGAFTDLGSYSQSYSASDSTTARLELRGSSLSLLIDGTARISVTDAAISAAGRVALAPYHSDAATGYHFDSITAHDHIVIGRRRQTLAPALAEPVFDFTW